MRRNSEIHHIIVAEDSPIVREGLLQVLVRLTAVHVHAVAVSTVHSLYDMLRVRPFHVVFVSPGFGGGFDVGEFRLRHPDVPCVAVVSQLSQLPIDPHYSGYVTIHSGVEDVLNIVVSTRDSLKKDFSQSDDDVALSLREKEILVEIARGRSNKEIADKLCIAVYTVGTHRRNICRKLDIHSAAGLTVYAMAHGLLDV